MKKTIAFLLLLLGARVSAQPFALPGRTNIENVYTTLLGAIDSATAISTASPLLVPITHGAGAAFGNIEGKPFTVCVRGFSDRWGPREYFECDTAWSGTVTDSSGFAPDTLRFIARDLTNSTRSTWPSGSFVSAGSRYDLQIVEDSVNYGLLHLNAANATTGTLAITRGGTNATTPASALANLGGIGWTLPAPASSTASGIPGQISYDASGNFYICVATNQWAKFTGSISGW